MHKVKVVKKPVESEVIMVRKTELLDMLNKHSCISISNHDREYIKKYHHEEIVGVIAGDIDDLDDMKNDSADCWFINISYFAEYYSVIDEDQ